MDEYAWKIIPADVAVKRFYRVYLRIPLDSDPTDEEIKKAIKQMIVANNDELFQAEDPEMEIEENDITVCNIDYDGIFNE